MSHVSRYKTFPHIPIPEWGNTADISIDGAQMLGEIMGRDSVLGSVDVDVRGVSFTINVTRRGCEFPMSIRLSAADKLEIDRLAKSAFLRTLNFWWSNGLAWRELQEVEGEQRVAMLEGWAERAGVTLPQQPVLN